MPCGVGYDETIEGNIRRFGIEVLHGIDRQYGVTFYDPPLDPSRGVLLSSGASSSRAINGDCVRGRPVSHVAVQADEVAYRTPVGRSIIDGVTEEEREALLNWYRAQRRRVASSESASSRQSVSPEPSRGWSAWCTPKVPFAIVLPTGGYSMGGDSPSTPSSDRMRIHDTIQDEEPIEDPTADDYSVYGDILVQHYGYPPTNGPQLFVSTPLYNKFVGRFPAHFGRLRMRNVKVGQPACADRVYVGEVVRHGVRTWVHHVVGRQAIYFSFRVACRWCSSWRYRLFCS